ncbi:MAG: ABC transporter ATP-binding protein, partial [Deltaproteobacteria bacterium]|nr:ABC transporter ATP-binding protein [Deltaproteobacteria bacterium]
MGKIRLISPYFRVNLWGLLLGFLALSLCDFAQLTIPKLVGMSIDVISREYGEQSQIIHLLIVILCLSIIVALLRYFWRHLIYGFSRDLEKDLRRRLYFRFTHLSLNWHGQNSSGDLMALATNDIEAVRLAVGFGMVSLVDAVVLGITAILFMLSINIKLSLL